MDIYTTSYISKSEENYNLYDFLKENDKFKSWQIVALFYSALCYVKAYLYNKNIPKNSLNSHESIKSWLATETDAKRLNVLLFYEKLYFDSRDARYSTKTISEQRIAQALINYEKVKSLLNIN